MNTRTGADKRSWEKKENTRKTRNKGEVDRCRGPRGGVERGTAIAKYVCVCVCVGGDKQLKAQ